MTKLVVRDSVRYVRAWKTLAELGPRSQLMSALHARDGHRCFYCRATPSPAHVDHVTPRPRGSDNFDNLVLACGTCNLLKGATPGWFFMFWMAARGRLSEQSLDGRREFV